MSGGRTTSLPAAAGAAGAGRAAGPVLRFDDVFTFGNLHGCALECCNGVRWKASTQLFEASAIMWAADVLEQLRAGAYRSRGFNRFTIRERGKVRHIQSVHISERMVQKCLVRHCLRPLVMPKLIRANHATLPGHGTDEALRELREHLRWWHARHGREGGVLVMDYRDYFACVRHDELKRMYARLGMDERLYDLTCHFIDCFEGDSGLGLGSEVSQISALLYVNGIDHFMKDCMGFHCYARYMDDSYAVGGLDDLELALGCVEVLSRDLGLSLNPKATRIARLRGGSFSYLKKRVSMTEAGRVVMRLDRSNVTRERRRVKANAARVAAGGMAAESEEQSWRAWRAYASNFDAHRTLQRMAAERGRALAAAGCAIG